MSVAYSIRETAQSERPRERLERHGASQLSDAELLAIVLNTGTVGEGVMSLANRMLREHDGFRGLMRLEVKELKSIRGLGLAKGARLKATLEIARRVAVQGADRPEITSPDDVVNLLDIEMAALEQEQLRVVLLDTKHRVERIPTVYQGSVNQAQVRISEVFRDAIRLNAPALIVVHNHPSGDPTPSASDVALTADVAKAGQLLGIEVLDHLIIGRGRHVSLRRLGLGFTQKAAANT
jgi:DNA repair protein RadC